MLSIENNERITRTGPGTPAGEMLRRYWLPIALPAQLEAQNPLPVEVMGEKLALFRSGRGELGLVQDRCAHRGTSLARGNAAVRTTGRIDPEGVRCCYHGWLYGPTGQCLDMPGEPEGSSFSRKIRIPSHAVAERYGFIWAKLSLAPEEMDADSIPPLDTIARTDGFRASTIGIWPCNYFQVCENLVDPAHVSVLHLSTEFEQPKFNAMPKVRAEETALGMKTIAGRPGYEREVEILMPTGIRLALPIMEPPVQLAFWAVPVNDELTHTFHSWFVPFEDGIPDREKAEKIARIKAFMYQQESESPLYHSSMVNAQDKFATASQGRIADRTLEHLGTTDTGVIMFRKVFQTAMAEVEAGRPPKGAAKRWAAGEILHCPNVN